MTISVNNQSIQSCKEIAVRNGWEKESRRNVVLIDGEKWSFSTTNNNKHKAECRQCYADTVGFITNNTESNTMYSLRVGDHNSYSVTRVMANGIKAHNITKHVVECDVVTNGIVK